MSSKFVCKICDNSFDNALIVANEMMFQTKAPFQYFLCKNCGCMQIAEIPKNIGDYYSNEYYSFNIKYKELSRGGIPNFLKRKLFSHFNVKKNLIGSILSIFKKDSFYWWPKYHMDFEGSILDVGSGNGSLLTELYNCGLNNIEGIDPYIQNSIEVGNGIKVKKKSLYEIEKKYDLIMMHHSFEHMDEPIDVLKEANKKLVTGGILLIRIPVSDSYAFEEYGKYWVQFDAPRHFYLHTKRSIDIAAQKTEFDVVSIKYDSSGFQFWASECYKKEIPLTEAFTRKDKIFTKEQLKNFENQANKLNEQGRGDSACFLLKKR